MSYYVAPFTFDFVQSLILVDDGVTNIDCDGLYDALKLAQASEEGILYARIAAGSGLVPLGDGVFVGLTVELLGAWQLKFVAGAYITKIAGGNLVGGPGGDPIAYSAGVQNILMQSAAATAVLSGGGGTTPGEVADAVWTHPKAADVEDLAALHGLDPANPLVVTSTSRNAGSVTQTIADVAGTVTVQRT